MKIRILVFALGMSSGVFANNDMDPKIPEFPYKSPEAISFQRNGQYNVGEYTGTVDISFPIYTIKYKDIELPITLSYNSSGVKVESEASWVGLNWELNVGGCVNLIAAGGHDNLSSKEGTWEEYQTVLEMSKTFGSTFFSPRYYSTAQDSGSYDYLRDFLNQKVYTSHDFDNLVKALNNSKGTEHVLLSNGVMNDAERGLTEQDYYQVTLPSCHFIFYINHEGTPIIIGNMENKCKVVKRNDGWKITDGDGYVYILNNCERSKNSLQGYSESAWYLSEIRSPLGNTLELTYTSNRYIVFYPTFNETNRIVLNKRFIYAYGPESEPMSNYGYRKSLSPNSSDVDKGYLKSISTEDQTVDFVLSGERIDIRGGAMKLDSIIVRSNINGQRIKTVAFDYDYFDSNSVGGDYLLRLYQSTTPETSRKRLKLKGFSICDNLSNRPIENYIFGYNESMKFPCKTSCAQDMWGYYNGQENKIRNIGYSLIPRTVFCDVDSLTFAKTMNEDGANRFANARYTSSLSLQRITYPTGGYTEFVYEPNSFVKEYQNPMSSGKYFKKVIKAQDINYPSNLPGGPTIKNDFINDSPQFGTLKVIMRTGNYFLSDLKAYSANVEVRIWDDTQKTYALVRRIDLNSEGSSYNISESKLFEKDVPIYLPAGRGFIVANLPNKLVYDSYSRASVEGELTLYPSLEKRPIETIGGGLRIKSISNYDKNNRLLERTDYDYVNEDGSSSGKLVITPFFFKDQMKISYFCNKSNSFSAPVISESLIYERDLLMSNHSTGMTSFVSLINSNPVGYSRVVKNIYSSDKKTSVVSTYKNTELRFENDNTCVHCVCDNGLLLSQTVLDSLGNICSVLKNEYKTTKSTILNNFMIESILTAQGNRATSINMFRNRENVNKVTCYPFVQFLNQKTHSSKTEFVNGVPSTSVHTNYEYNPKNYRISMIENYTDRDENRTKTRYWYTVDSLDLCSECYLTPKNILNNIVQIEESNICNDTEKVVARLKTRYDSKGRKDVENYAKGSAALTSRIFYTYENNNLCYIHKDMEQKIVYIWSYRGMYPIAEVQGLTLSEVKKALSRDLSLDTLFGAIPTADDYTKIRNAMKKAGALVTTYEYIPLIGISSITQPNGNKTKFEYDGFGRLVRTSDTHGHVISTNCYNYQK